MPHFRAERTVDTPVMDGRLDDAVWRKAPSSDAFIQKFPKEGQTSSERTTMRVLYDDEAIYFGFDCIQQTSPLVRRLTRRDRSVESDWVGVVLGTRGDGKSAFDFWVNAAGTLNDALRYDDTGYSTDWDENWDARTAVTAHGWSAEIRIPFRILRFSSLPVQSWDFEARRYISAKQETDEWAYIPRATAGEVSHYGKLDNLVGLKSGNPLELRPFVLGRIRRRDASTDTLARGTDGSVSAGLDLKWHPTQDLTWDATFNPDFAQVEADQLVLNLSKYEVYYPEKRPFFLEGLDMFSTPYQLVYTRRIGRVAASPTLRTSTPYNEQLVDVPDPAAIYGASKLVGRLGNGWTMGSLSALTAPSHVPVQLANGQSRKQLVDPVTAFNVIRLKRDIGDNAHVGLLATSTTRTETTDRYPIAPGGPPGIPSYLCPDGSIVQRGARCFHNAYVGGLDWLWHSPSGDYVLTGQVLASAIEQGPMRTLADGTSIQSGDSGRGGGVSFSREGGSPWLWHAEAWGGSRKLDVNDLGYLIRQNYYLADAQLKYRTLDPWWNTLETLTVLGIYGRNNLEGLPTDRSNWLYTQWKFKNFWQASAELHYRPSLFDDREVGDGTALERAGLMGTRVTVATDSRSMMVGKIDALTDFLFDGFNAAFNGEVTTHPMPQLELSLLPQAVYTFGEPRYAAMGQTSGQYLFGKLLAKNLGATVRATYAFVPGLTLQAYGQLFLASGHYSDFSSYQSDPSGGHPVVYLRALKPGAPPPLANPDFENPALNINLVLRWEYQLGSTLGPAHEKGLDFGGKYEG